MLMIPNVPGCDDDPYVLRNIITMFCQTGLAFGRPVWKTAARRKILRGLAHLCGDTSDRQQRGMEYDMIGLTNNELLGAKDNSKRYPMTMTMTVTTDKHRTILVQEYGIPRRKQPAMQSLEGQRNLLELGRILRINPVAKVQVEEETGAKALQLA
jgi:hypothetical protein